jgi:hypothetical protein
MITYLPIEKIKKPLAVMWGGPNAYTSINPGYTSSVLLTKSVIAEVREVFRGITKDRLVVWFQQIDKRFNGYVHVDPRTYTLSYLLDAGGSQVTTCLHNADHTVRQSICLEPERWHIIKTDELHSVNDIEGTRVSLSISVGEQINSGLLPWCNSMWTKTNGN